MRLFSISKYHRFEVLHSVLSAGSSHSPRAVLSVCIASHISEREGGKKVKILFKSMCACVLLEAQLSGKCVCSSVCLCARVCVCAHSSHRGSALSQYAAPFSVCAAIQPRKLCALQIIIFAVTPLDPPSPLFGLVCVCLCVCVCTRRGKRRQ